MPRVAVVVLLIAGSVQARPVEMKSGQVRAAPFKVTEANLPLRVVVRSAGVRLSNCVFSSQPIPPHARASTPLSYSFAPGDPMFARCYLPDVPGANRPGDLTDVFWLDGKRWWTQAYDAAVPPDALERSVMLGEVLRTPLATLPPGNHRIELWGQIKRGSRVVKLYHGEFHYVR